MESGRRNLPALGKSAAVVAERGRFYVLSKRYTQVTVFSLNRRDVDELRSHFGGHVYRHRSGFVWVLSKYQDLRRLYDQLSEYPELQRDLKQKLLLAGREWDPVDEEELLRGRE